jgi:hypothetical protein
VWLNGRALLCKLIALEFKLQSHQKKKKKKKRKDKTLKTNQKALWCFNLDSFITPPQLGSESSSPFSQWGVPGP